MFHKNQQYKLVKALLHYSTVSYYKMTQLACVAKGNWKDRRQPVPIQNQ